MMNMSYEKALAHVERRSVYGCWDWIDENLQCVYTNAYPVMLPMVQEECQMFSERLWIMRSHPLRMTKLSTREGMLP
jgi:hypothetical protein